MSSEQRAYLVVAGTGLLVALAVILGSCSVERITCPLIEVRVELEDTTIVLDTIPDPYRPQPKECA